MKDNKKILIGVATNGKGGVDSYILSFVKIANLSNIECHVLTTNFSKNYEEKLEENSSKLYEISNLHDKKNIAKTITKLNRKNKYFAAYWNISTCLMYPYVKAASDCKIPNNIVHSHAHYNSQPNVLKTFIYDAAHYFYRAKMNKLNLKYAACSTDCAKWIAGNNIVNTKKWTFVPNPINVEACKFNQNKREEIRKIHKIDGKYVIGCATAFLPYKNPLFLIKVFNEIWKLNKEAYLLLAGDGPMQNEVEKLASNILEKQSYKLLGHVNNVPDLLQAFDCFVLPSKNEGLPLCLLEAQAASLPCVMSENITDEVIVLNSLIQKISFDKGEKIWAEEILKLIDSNKDKRNEKSAKEVSDSGFNLYSPKKVLPLLGF